MKKYLNLVTLTILSPLLISCGGTENITKNPNSMLTKDTVSIIYHYPEEACLSSLLISTLQRNVPNGKNFITSVETNNVNCSTYQHILGKDCSKRDMISEDIKYSKYQTSCVIGADVVTNDDNYLFENMILMKESISNFR